MLFLLVNFYIPVRNSVLFLSSFALFIFCVKTRSNNKIVQDTSVFWKAFYTTVLPQKFFSYDLSKCCSLKIFKMDKFMFWNCCFKWEVFSLTNNRKFKNQMERLWSIIETRHLRLKKFKMNTYQEPVSMCLFNIYQYSLVIFSKSFGFAIVYLNIPFVSIENVWFIIRDSNYSLFSNFSFHSFSKEISMYFDGKCWIQSIRFVLENTCFKGVH